MQQCGIGNGEQYHRCREMIDNYHPDLVISSGVAGGADINLNVTEVVVANQLRLPRCLLRRGMRIRTDSRHACFSSKHLRNMWRRHSAINNLPGNRHPEDPRRTDCERRMVSVDSKEKMRSILEHFPQCDGGGYGELLSSPRPATSTRRLSSPSASSAMYR